MQVLSASRSELRLVPYEEAYAKGFEDMRRRVPSITKIRQLIGWQPTKNLDEITAATLLLKEAGGDHNKARELARKRGMRFD